jgi:hypothetical protein
MRRDVLAIVQRFAAALDAEDYSSARELLAPNCTYHLGDDTIVGQNAVVDSYRANGQSAKQRFDSIEYASNVQIAGLSTAIINFTDRIRIGNECHEYRCRQSVTVGSNGLVEGITHEELPRERERLRDFEARLKSRGS